MRAGLHFPDEAAYQRFLSAYQSPQSEPRQALDAPISPLPSPTPTDAAKRLLAAILAVPLPGLWVREHTFHESRDWRIDIALPHAKIGLEIDGGVHRIKKRFLADIEKWNALTFAGWRVLRCTPAQVDSGEALALIHAFLQLSSPPSP